MIGEVLRVGDEVSITVPQENRDWGYNPCPDATRAVVLGFSEIHYGRINNFGFEPGVYPNNSWVKLRLEDGRESIEFASRLELTDKGEYERRVAELRELNQVDPDSWHKRKEFIRDLPETPFWEGDVVLVHKLVPIAVVSKEMLPESGPEVFVVVGIDYAYLDEKTTVGTKYPAYRISDQLNAGWYTSASEDEMELVERGLIWKYHHGEPLQFADIKEEASFFQMLGLTEEVRNPANGLFKWTKDEVLAAIQEGIVHGFSMSSGFFGTKPIISARRFRDEELGKRVAQATLEGFGLA